MFSKKTLMVVGVIFLVGLNIIVLSITSSRYQSSSAGKLAISLVAPFQKIVTFSIRFIKDIWYHYFSLVSVTRENENLKRALSQAIEKNNQCQEIELSNLRLRNLLNFQKTVTSQAIAAGLIGKDPSPWFKSIIIDKGRADGVEKGFPVVVPEGIVGQVIDVSSYYSKVMLIIDQNSAVDALVQKTRARGIVKGESTDRCIFQYVLRKHDINIGEEVVSSGLDGVFPKGLRIGRVSGVIRRTSGIFQEVSITPNVDFEKLEEVLIILNPPRIKFEIK
ncbi:rod shape-determining protein MreC [Thermodesulfobacteriota bacterium]